jgi:hypothetical protein
MLSRDSEPWLRARRARELLIRDFIDHPDVSLIELGFDEDPGLGEPQDQLVLRVHVRRETTAAALGLPAEVEGIPVRAVTGDYYLE